MLCRSQTGQQAELTRRRGMVPVRLSRHRAIAFGRWLGTFQPLDRTILGTALMTQHEIEEEDYARTDGLNEMMQILLGKPTGRPRDPVSSYHLPVAVIRLLDTGHGAMSVPRRLRPVLKQIVRATKRKKGPKLPPWLRAKNLAHGKYAPETVRRYEWLARKEVARQRLRQMQTLNPAELNEYQKSMPKPGTPAFSILAMMAARRWLD